jgi:hypothetical protein
MEFFHILGKPTIAPNSWHAFKRGCRIFRKLDFDTPVNRVGSAKGVIDSRQNGMFGLTAKMVHKTNRARFLTAKVKAAVQMEDADRRHTCLSFMYRPDAIYE